MRHICICTAMYFFVFANMVVAEEKLRFSKFEAPNLIPLAEQIISRAYAELGISIETVKANPRRALLDAAGGKTDGDLVRVHKVGSLHESLIRVEVPVIVARIYAFSNKPELRGRPFGELKHLRIGHVAGAKFAQDLAVDFLDVWTADSAEQLFEMLQRDRLDLVIVGERTGPRIIRERKLSGIIRLQPALREIPFYHYLHEKHADLAPKVEEVLRRNFIEKQNKIPNIEAADTPN
ncbi:hypothetical protein LP7551_00109 [Roseibium album]|nr:hypothetical protein LP7551_00109 [Roseibium album]